MTDVTSADQNPFLELDEDGAPLYQLKLSLVVYLDYAPGPQRARRVYEGYLDRFEKHIKFYQSTSWLGPPYEWNLRRRARFERQQLLDLHKQDDWGYAFADGKSVDYHLFMFHGYRPVTEARKASFFRFEWPWNWDPQEIAAFATSLADTVPFLSGTGGYIISARPFNTYAYGRMYALCRRYLGLEAWNLDKTVNFVRRGYKCPSWLTLIGHRLLEQPRDQEVTLESVRNYAVERAHGLVFQSRPRPQFIDGNRREPHAGETAIANALLPLQIVEHEDFGGPYWEGNTMKWLYRFSNEGVVRG
jgi:hypothetical protein